MSINVYSDEYFMKQALNQAQMAYEHDEVPVGAVVVHQGKKIIARAYNQTEQLQDVTAHAEMLAITAAANYIGAKYLKDCALYVTLEPCVMCAGAVHWAQLDKIVYAATDDKKGFSKLSNNIISSKTIISNGILEQESKELLQSFFKRKR